MLGEQGRDAPNDVVRMRFDVFMLGIVPLPIVPAGIVVHDGYAQTSTAMIVGGAVLAVVACLYLVAWLVSRGAGERRFLFYDDGVWLPACYHRLWGQFVPYRSITMVKRHGTADRHLLIRFHGGMRDFEHNVVDPEFLEGTFASYLRRPAKGDPLTGQPEPPPHGGF